MSDSTLQVEADDGAWSELTVFRAPRDAAAAPVFVCLPAMGVPKSYYTPLAEALRGQGFHAVTADLRGIGPSSVRAGRHVDFGYHEMGEFDLAETFMEPYGIDSLNIVNRTLESTLEFLELEE